MEAMVGTPKRIALIAKDIVDHFEKRLEAMDGKAMIVCMSRRICVELYKEIAKLRPQWHSDDDEKGALKVVMTGSAADVLDFQPHIRNKPAANAWRIVSRMRTTRSSSSSSAICGSPDSTRPACTPCTPISPCSVTASCKPSPASIASSRTSQAASSSTTSASRTS